MEPELPLPLHPDDVNRTPKGVLDACIEEAIKELDGATGATVLMAVAALIVAVRAAWRGRR